LLANNLDNVLLLLRPGFFGGAVASLHDTKNYAGIRDLIGSNRSNLVKPDWLKKRG